MWLGAGGRGGGGGGGVAFVAMGSSGCLLLGVADTVRGVIQVDVRDTCRVAEVNLVQNAVCCELWLVSVVVPVAVQTQ